MCGIIGVTGEPDALGVILAALHKLEYRGYDSAGVALVAALAGLQVFLARRYRRVFNPAVAAATVLAVAFSPNGQTLAVGDLGGDIGLWATATGAGT